MSEKEKIVPDPKIKAGHAAKCSKVRGAAAPLGEALADFLTSDDSDYFRFRNHVRRLEEVLGALGGLTAATFEEFWGAGVGAGLETVFGRGEARVLRRLCELDFESPYAHSAYRPSYRSLLVSDYLNGFARVILTNVDFLCTGLGLAETLLRGRSHEHRLALALRDGDAGIGAIVDEAVLGPSDGPVRLGHELVRAIVRSGVEKHVAVLGQLLLATTSQEGVRQAVLENADAGGVETLVYFIRICVERKLARFSAVARALATWTGLGLDEARPAIAAKCYDLALAYLSGDREAAEGLESPDVFEAHMALWSVACRDVHRAVSLAGGLTSSKEKYLRLLGWYFINGTASEGVKHRAAAAAVGVRDPEELAWVCQCLHANYSLYSDPDVVREPDPAYPADLPGRRAEFAKIVAAAEFIGNKKTDFPGSVFPWSVVQLDSAAVFRTLLSLAGVDRDRGMVRELVRLLHLMDSSVRRDFYHGILLASDQEHRSVLLAKLDDKSTENRKLIVEKLGKVELSAADLDAVSECLGSQSASLRTAVTGLLGGQSEQSVLPVVEKLLASKNAKMLLSGVELADLLSRKNQGLAASLRVRIDEIKSRPNIPKDLAVILERFDFDAGDWTLENGFGLYDPASDDLDPSRFAARLGQPAPLSGGELALMLTRDEGQYFQVAGAVARLLDENKTTEVEVEYYDGSKGKVLLGDCDYHLPALPRPRAEELRASLGLRNLGLLGYYFAGPVLEVFDSLDPDVVEVEKALWHGESLHQSHFTKEAAEIFQGLPYDKPGPDLEKVFPRRHNLLRNIVRSIMEIRHGSAFEFAMTVWRDLARLVPDELVMKPYAERDADAKYYYLVDSHECMLNLGLIEKWRATAWRHVESPEQFRACFGEAWRQYLLTGRKNCGYGGTELLFEAAEAGLIGPEAVRAELLTGMSARTNMRNLTWPASTIRKNVEKRFPFISEVLAEVVDRIVSVEERRGEMPTPLTAVASEIQKFVGGSAHFAALLKGLGGDNFFRGYAWGEASSKQESLSRLLRRCFPSPEDTPEILGEALEKAGVPRGRLLEAVMYAPQWADLAERALPLKGLASAVWLFHAHVSETFSADKETRVGLHSAVTPREFADGVFDRDWFDEAYRAVGPEVFADLYKSAKYISSTGAYHRRSQLYVDAVLGRLDKAEVMAEVRDKRNQEKLRAMGLIPLDPSDPSDALGRYEFIQKYAKESRKFGSARQASEGLAARIALRNLALVTGFDDVDRLSWTMETEKLESLRHLLVPRDVEGYEVSLEISLEGDARVAVDKDGKELKSMPKAIAKNEAVLELAAAAKDFADQKKRSRLSFEMAMISRTEFQPAEIARLLDHPVIRPMVSSLVFVSGEDHGFPTLENGRLRLSRPGRSDGPAKVVGQDAGKDAGQNVEKAGGAAKGADKGAGKGKSAAKGVEKDAGKGAARGKGKTAAKAPAKAADNEPALRLAHPHDLIKAKAWAAYQRHLYEKGIVQPFKQVFREYYPATKDELDEVNVSRRYAGHQVQPQKTLALLKTRGWTVDNEEGLQRVCHRDNLVARMYAMADWFSPADIEAPTLEVVRFFSRDKNEPVAFKDISPVIFSEVMRDIDLVVSVAHVGDVDPEASHSTIEMRAAVAAELVRLLGLGNVAFKGAHALVKGSLGEYSVHLGSGVVHQSGVGMLAILPVHSQARGRIFLPFVDNDPRTAEIMSKILLLAEDTKIKDPAILAQIKN